MVLCAAACAGLATLCERLCEQFVELRQRLGDCYQRLPRFTVRCQMPLQCLQQASQRRVLASGCVIGSQERLYCPFDKFALRLK